MNSSIAKQTKIMKSFKAEQAKIVKCCIADQTRRMKSYRAEQTKLVGDPVRHSLLRTRDKRHNR